MYEEVQKNVRHVRFQFFDIPQLIRYVETQKAVYSSVDLCQKKTFGSL